jgi:hypothetical protein
MKKILGLIFAFGTLGVFAQSTTFLPTAFTNKKTNKHIHIPGTRFYMIPPDGFHTVTGNTALTKNKGFDYEFQELKTPRHLKGIYESYGFKTTDSALTKFDNYQAVIYEMYLSGYYICMLNFWDSSFTASVTLTCPQADSSEYESAKKAFTSIYYDRSIVPDPYEVANFHLDNSMSEFKFSEYSNGVFTYTPGGIILTETPSSTHPAINIFVQERDPNISANTMVERAKSVLSDRGMKIIEATMLPTIKINLYEAAEMEVYGRQNFIKYKTYIAAIQDKENIILIVGFIPVDYDENMIKMKDFSRLIVLGKKKPK